MAEVTDILKKLISIKSVNSQSNEEITNEIKNMLSKFEVRTFEFTKVDSATKKSVKLFNLVVKIKGDSDKNPLVFSGHTDTVELERGWSVDPFFGTNKDGRVYGLGSCDMKAGLACFISAALSLKKNPKRDIYLLFDADEEGSGLGGNKMIEDLKLKNSQVVIAEPTDRSIIYGQKGCLDFIIEVKGIASHSSGTNLSNNLKNNAIYRMLKIQQEFLKYESEIEKMSDALFGKPSFNMGKISGGSGANVVADYCILNASRRLLPTENLSVELKKIKMLVSQIDSNAKVTETFVGEPFIVDKKSKFGEKLSSLSKKFIGESKFDVKSGWTEAALFSSYGETFIFGPGTSEMCHKLDESVSIKDLKAFKEIYRSLMED